MQHNQIPSITVSIITCYGGDTMLDTVKSLRASTGVEKFRFIILADRVRLSDKLKAGLAQYDIELIEKPDEELTPHQKWKYIRAMTTTDLLVLTQDDVIFEPDTLAKVVRQFTDHPETKIVNIRNIPVQAENFFEAGVNVGTSLANRIGELWNKGDNYISLLGRAMVFNTEWFKKFPLPGSVVSSDAYFYILNKKMGGVYASMPHARILFRNPQNILEHWRKSSRFQNSKKEMTDYFDENLDALYYIPRSIILRAGLHESLKNPIAFFTYCSIYLYTRLFKESAQKSLIANWEVDQSTKQVLK